jgi:hypothetical protein
VLLMLGLDRFTPHEHESSGPCGPGCERIGRVWLFVLAITLHNLPEGMAIGVSFAQGDMGVGLPLTSAIAIQDIPEGLAVVMALRAAGVGSWPAVLMAGASGLMEPLGSLFGAGIAGGLALAYPVGLGLAAGAMIFVVSHEVIPNPPQRPPDQRHPRADGGFRGDDVPGYGDGLADRFCQSEHCFLQLDGLAGRSDTIAVFPPLPAIRAPGGPKNCSPGDHHEEEIRQDRRPVMDIGISADDRAEIAAGLSRLLPTASIST